MPILGGVQMTSARNLEGISPTTETALSQHGASALFSYFESFPLSSTKPGTDRRIVQEHYRTYHGPSCHSPIASAFTRKESGVRTG